MLLRKVITRTDGRPLPDRGREKTLRRALLCPNDKVVSLKMGGEHAPNPPRYDADGSGRDTYIRRDPQECFGKTLYKSAPRIPTRFGAAGSVLSRDRHSGYCGYTLGAPGTAEYDEGSGGRVGGEGGGGLKVVQARYLMPVPPAFEVEVRPAPCTVHRAPCSPP